MGEGSGRVTWARLLLLTSGAFATSGGTYGSPRITAALAGAGVRVGRRRVIAAMQALGLVARRGSKPAPRGNRKNRRRISRAREAERCCQPDLVRRRFSPEGLDTVWVADTTTFGTERGPFALGVVLDLASRRVLAWRTCVGAQSARLVCAVLHDAFRSRGPGAGLVVHSDRGGEFANRRVQGLLVVHGARPSMSRRGNCWDNAVAESFFATLKRECLYLSGPLSVAKTRERVSEFIGWYNEERLHSTLGYLSPVQFERRTTTR